VREQNFKYMHCISSRVETANYEKLRTPGWKGKKKANDWKMKENRERSVRHLGHQAHS
jgi:hypothetical protein